MLKGSISIRSTTIGTNIDEIKEYLANLDHELQELEKLSHNQNTDPIKQYSPKLQNNNKLLPLHGSLKDTTGAESLDESYLEELSADGNSIMPSLQQQQQPTREHRISKLYNRLRQNFILSFRRQHQHQLPIPNTTTVAAQQIVPEPAETRPIVTSTEPTSERISSMSRYSSIRYPNSVLEVYMGEDLYDKYTSAISKNNYDLFTRQYSLARPSGGACGDHAQYSLASIIGGGSTGMVPIRRDSIDIESHNNESKASKSCKSSSRSLLRRSSAMAVPASEDEGSSSTGGDDDSGCRSNDIDEEIEKEDDEEGSDALAVASSSLEACNNEMESPLYSAISDKVTSPTNYRKEFLNDNDDTQGIADEDTSTIPPSLIDRVGVAVTASGNLDSVIITTATSSATRKIEQLKKMLLKKCANKEVGLEVEETEEARVEDEIGDIESYCSITKSPAYFYKD